MKRLLLALAWVSALPAAQAQTGRVTQGGYGGRGAARLHDNFGIVPAPTGPSVSIWADRVVYLNDSIAVLHEWWQVQSTPLPPWERHVSRHQYYYRRYHQSRAVALQRLREDFPKAKLEGFNRPVSARKKPGGKAALAAPGRSLRKGSGT